MFNVSSFLEKISKNLLSQEVDLQKICDIIFDKTNINCDPKSIKINNNIIHLDVSPGVKGKIFMNKQSILDSFTNSNIKITDIR